MTAPTTVLRLEGRDALDLIHRLSTASLLDLAPGHARWTLFCDFRGRLLHRALVAVTADGAVWLLRDDAPGPELAAHVHGHLFREVVRIGLGETRWGARLVAARPGLEPGAVRERDGAPETIALAEDRAMILVPAGATGPPPVEEATRIAEGAPRHGHEIAPEFNPYEVNLGDEVHLSKGCYTGQEALQRLVTYDSVRRALMRVAGDGAPPPVPAPLSAGGEDAGVVTSAAATGTGWVGLAVVRRAALADAAAFSLAGGGTLAGIEPFAVRAPQGRS
jgi:folate-binding protein YgfZ